VVLRTYVLTCLQEQLRQLDSRHQATRAALAQTESANADHAADAAAARKTAAESERKAVSQAATINKQQAELRVLQVSLSRFLRAAAPQHRVGCRLLAHARGRTRLLQAAATAVLVVP
jgi:hypothetical protein